MLSHEDFEVAAGGTIGRDHRVIVKNYQDAHLVAHRDHCTIALVTDGCSSGAYSELGARIGAHFFTRALERQACIEYHDRNTSIDWDRVVFETTAELGLLGLNMEGPSGRQIIHDHFLFTITGVLLRPIGATFFSFGDGFIAVNGKTYDTGSYENKPPYLGYRLLPTDRIDIDPADLELKLIERMPLESLDHFVIGSDGVRDLVAAKGRKLPGLTKQVPALDTFWEDGRYFHGNPDLVSRELRLAGRDWPRSQPEPGLLPDDTTLIVGRRKGGSG